MKALKFIFSLLYFGILCYAVFFAPRRRNHHYNYEVNFFPIKNSVHTFLTLDVNDRKEVYNFYSNLFGNISLFIPFPVALITLFKIEKLRSIVISAFLVSISIEILQYLFQIGLADIDDIILNTSGALIGFFLYKMVQQFKNLSLNAGN